MYEVFRNYETRAWDVEFIDTFYSKVRIPFGGKALSWPISHLFCHVNSKNNYLIIVLYCHQVLIISHIRLIEDSVLFVHFFKF